MKKLITLIAFISVAYTPVHAGLINATYTGTIFKSDEDRKTSNGTQITGITYESGTDINEPDEVTYNGKIYKEDEIATTETLNIYKSEDGEQITDLEKVADKAQGNSLV